MDLLDNEEVVISGIGGFFPNCRNIEDFKKCLLNNEDMLSSRWKEGEKGVSNRLGVIPDLPYFDTAYFGIHRLQAVYMDPMHRLILERTFEALIDAGVNPTEIRGRKIGVYMGSSIGENDNLFYESIASGFGVTGHSRAMMPNRVSYWLNLKGPSCSYDSNWVNGFEVIQLAYDAIKAGHIEAAIVGTANLALNAEISWLYNDMGLLSSDGITRSFDEDASGYARSDGVVVFYIQRAVDARRHYASILNVNAEYLGNRGGTYLDFDVSTMTEFLEDFYKKCNVDINDIEFLETYGAGLKKIDEAELNSLEPVFLKNRKTPLNIGSVKPNTGHAEASAAMFSIAKAIIAMESEIIPANIHYFKPNSNIPSLVDGRFKILTENTKYNGGLIAVNGLGLSSSMGHILLRPNLKLKPEVIPLYPNLFIASTRTEQGIKEIMEVAKNQPQRDPEYLALTHTAFSKSINSHLFRGYTVLDENVEGSEGFDYFTGNKRPIWFIYSGMGSQWCKMGKDLMQLPIFAESIQKSHKVLESKGVNLMEIITSEDPKTFDNILHSFVGIASIQIALTDVLYTLEVVPDGIIGHSVGELGCAYADGALTAEEMILCAYSRGRASLEANLIKGMMAAVGMGYNQIKDQLPATIEVACHNGPDSCTLSGPAEDMEKYVKELSDKGIFARLVNVADIAYHSRYIKPAAPLLLKYLKDVIKTPRLRSSKWISTSAPESKWNTDEAKYSSAEYHTNNLLGSVLFEEGSKHIPKECIAIEIAPHGLLQAILKRSLSSGCTNIALTNRQSKNNLHTLLAAIGKMYVAGIDLNPSLIFPKIEFPVSRGTSSLAPLVRWEHGEVWRTGLEDKFTYYVCVRDIHITINDPDFQSCTNHQLNDLYVMPINKILNLILDILNTSLGSVAKEFIFENLQFKTPIIVPKMGSVPVYAMLQKGSGNFEVTCNEEIVCTGKVTVPTSGDEFLINILEFQTTDDCVTLTNNDIYSEFMHRGHKYLNDFKCLKTLSLMEEGSISVVNNTNWAIVVEGLLQQVLFQKGEQNQKVMIPKSIQRLAISTEKIEALGEEFEAKYNYYTEIVAADGIQIMGVRATTLNPEKKPIYFDSVEIISFENPSLDNIECVINASIQIVLENFTLPQPNSILITEIETGNPSLMDSIKKVTSNYIEINVNIDKIKDSKIGNLISQSDPLLYIINDNINEGVVRILNSSIPFVLVRTNKNIMSYNKIIEFARFDVKGDSFSLLKKINNDVPRVINIKGDNLCASDVVKGTEWTKELKTLTSNIKNKVYLVSSLIPNEGFLTFVNELRSVKEFQNVRTVFLLDKKAPEFVPTSGFYQNLIRKDPMLSIYKDGCFNTVARTPINIRCNIRDNSFVPCTVPNMTLKLVGVNLKDETITNSKYYKGEIGNLDYLATNKDGEQIFGLAYIDETTCKFVPDPIFKWKVSEKILGVVEDVVTIPHAYVTAYYCLLYKANLKAGQTVLIQAGSTPIGVACIAVALSMGCQVFTTVTNDAQRIYLKKKFEGLIDRNILSYLNASFEPQFMLITGGVGAHVIINTLSENLLQASSRCIANYGTFIHIGKFDINENNTVGMKIFLKNTCLTTVFPENIFFIPDETKIKIRNLIEEEFEKCYVRILPKKIVEDIDLDNMISFLRNDNNNEKLILRVNDKFQIRKLLVDKANQYICDPKGSYFVYGGVAEDWVDMVEWLVLRGARKIVVSSDSKPQHTHINRRLSLLQSYFNSDIIYAPNKAQTKDGAAELLSEVYFVGPIQAIFLLPTKSSVTKCSEIKALQYIEIALRTVAPKAVLVNFVPSAYSVFQQRIDSSFAIFNVDWIGSLEFPEILYGLDDILDCKTKQIQIKYERVTDFDEESSQDYYKKLALILPTIEDLTETIKHIDEEPKLIQLSSLGPRTIREVPPIFIIPGMSGFKIIKEMASKLLYPIFCARLPLKPMSITDLASVFAKKIEEVFPRGPYNLVASSCGGPLAIEIAKILQNKKNVQLTLIDGAPDTIQASLKHLGEGIHNEINYLTRILNISDANVIDKMQTLPNWESRVQAAVDNSDIVATDVLKRFIDMIRNHIKNIMHYKPTENLAFGKIYLLRPSGSSKYDTCGITKYCKKTADITVFNGDHLSVMNNNDLIYFINDKLAVK